MGLDGVFGGGLGWFVVLGGVFGFVVRFVRGFVFFIVFGFLVVGVWVLFVV